MIRNLLIGVMLCVCSVMHGQTVEQIKRDKATYLYGEGWAESVQKADRQALDDIISQISVSVSSDVGYSESSSQVGCKVESESDYEMIIKTYSQATLTNTQRIIVENEPDAHVFRYIRRVDIERIFESRKRKVENMIEEAQQAEENGQVNDALRYYYWAHALVKSLQHPNEFMLKDMNGEEHMAHVWIPKQMNEVFDNLDIAVSKVDERQAYLAMYYKDQPVNSVDFSYFDGRGWSNIHTAQDGVGLIELRTGIDMQRVQVKVEFVFETEAVVDPEVKEILAVVPPTVYREAYRYLDLNEASEEYEVIAPQVYIAKQTKREETRNNARVYDAVTEVENRVYYEQQVNEVVKAIANQNLSDMASYFTDEGMKAFEGLIGYGSASVVDCSNVKFYSFGDKVYCRNVLMNFRFKTNNKTFVENVVFEFDKDKKISNLTLGLSRQATDDIFSKIVWPEAARVILTHFLEGYKTAYSLKQIDYVESVFADDALIITGNYVRKATANDAVQVNFPNVKYTTQSKEEYVKRLRYIFKSNEYINLKFADNRIVKAGKGGEIYGVEIKQEYYSSLYGDTGYLFLMVDLNDAEKPVIHVRTWQPEKDPNFGVYGLEHF